MTISAEKEAMILRLYHVERWRCGTIATQLHCHHTTVFRVLKEAGLHRHRPVIRPAEIDQYLPFVQRTLATYPDLTASPLYGMVQERRYKGSSSHFRHMIALHRPRKAAEAFLRLRTPPGEQG